MNAFEQLRQDWTHHLSKSWNSRTAGSNNASQLGHDCLRFLTLVRTRGSERTRPDDRSIRRMRRGQLDEERVLRQIGEMGYKVIETQRPFEWPKYQIRGMIDCKLELDGQFYCADVKSVDPRVFALAVKEFGAGKVENKWLKKHVVQVTTYNLMDNKETGALLYYDPVANDIFPTPVVTDYELGEACLKKCECVNGHLSAGTLPEGLNDPDECFRCDLLHVCAPPIEAPDVLGDPAVAQELEEIIDRRREIKAMIGGTLDEDEDLKEREKVLCNGVAKINLTKFIITGKEITVKPKGGYSYWGHWIREK